MSDHGAIPFRPFAIFSPNGCYYLGLHKNFADCWTVAFGWPPLEEIAAKKASGWYCVEGTFSYTSRSPIDAARPVMAELVSSFNDAPSKEAGK